MATPWPVRRLLQIAGLPCGCLDCYQITSQKVTLSPRSRGFFLKPLCVDSISGLSGLSEGAAQRGQVRAWEEVELGTWTVGCRWKEDLVNINMTVMWAGVHSGGNAGHWSVASLIFAG